MVDKKKLIEGLDELREAQQKAHEEYEAKNDAWWNSLTEEEREDAFYAVIKRMYKAEVEDRGSYRWALYDVFGFDTSMYGRGMNCGYFNLHNIIYAALDKNENKDDNSV